MRPIQFTESSRRANSVFRFCGLLFSGKRCEYLLWNLSKMRIPIVEFDDAGNLGFAITPLPLIFRTEYYWFWLRMYLEVAMLGGLFMISPRTVQREIRFLLPVLWNYFKEQVMWPTAEQWL